MAGVVYSKQMSHNRFEISVPVSRLVLNDKYLAASLAKCRSLTVSSTLRFGQKSDSKPRFPLRVDGLGRGQVERGWGAIMVR